MSMTPLQIASHLEQGFKLYHWCDYWGQWSEILSIELNGHGLEVIRERTLGEKRVREHCTPPGKRDLFVSQLPLDVAARFSIHSGPLPAQV